MENLKKGISRVLSTVQTVGNAYEDKKIVIAEWIKIGASIVPLIWLFKHIPEIKADIETMTEEDVNKLMVEIKEEFNIPQEKVELVIEEALHIILVFISMIDLSKKKK